MSELKTCPFCGSEAESFSDVSFWAEDGRKIAEIKWFVWCTECSALVSGESKEEASEAWNRRTTAQSEITRCKDCKYFHYDMPYVIQGIPVLGHEVCDFWGDGCKTDENGWCFLAERANDGR